MADKIAKAHELEIANRFIEFLSQHCGTVYGPAEASEAPDALARDPAGNKVGVEVTCANYSDEEARNTWAIARGKPELSDRWVRPDEDIEDALRRMPMLVNFTPALIRSAQQAIDAHCLRSYGLPTYLVVDLSLPALTTAESAARIVPNLCVPKHSRFLGVYVALTPNFSSEVEFFPVTDPCA